MKYCFLLAFLISICLSGFIQAQSIDHPQVKWKFASDAPIRGGIASDDAHVYFGNAAGEIYCLNKQSGVQLWQFQANGAITSTPAIYNNLLLSVTRGNYVYALNINSGKLVWSFQMGASAPHAWGWDYYDASPLVHDDVVYIGSGDHHLYALNVTNGQQLWKFETGDKIRASQVVVKNELYAPSFDGHVYKLNRKNGKLLNKFKTKGVEYYGKEFGWDRTSLISTPAIKDSLMVFGSRDGGLYCLNLEKEKQKWRFSYGSSWVGSSPVIDGSTVFVGWSDQLVFSAVDLITGQELWKFNCGAYVYSTPAIDQKNVYVGAFNGKIYGFDKVQGQLLWEFQTAAPVLSSPLIDGELLYIGNDDGHLFAIEAGKEAFKAVYLPPSEKKSELNSDPQIGHYLTENGYQKLDTLTIASFMRNRIADKKPSVIVFAFQYLPEEVSGEKAENSLLKKYMESGGKVVWLNYFPKFWTTDKALNIVGYDHQYAAELLDLDFDVHMDFGTYFANSTEKGLEWKLPRSFNAPSSSVSNKSNVVPLAFNEFGRIAAFWKPFSENNYAGFVSFCSWSYMPIKQSDLETIKAIAELGLEE